MVCKSPGAVRRAAWQRFSISFRDGEAGAIAASRVREVYY